MKTIVFSAVNLSCDTIYDKPRLIKSPEGGMNMANISGVGSDSSTAEINN